MFQQTYSLFLDWLLLTQTHYQNRDKGCEKISNRNLRKLRKVGSSDLILNKLVLSKRFMSLKSRGSGKVLHLKSSCSRLIFCNQLFKYSVSGISLNNGKYTRKNFDSITEGSCCQCYINLFISQIWTPLFYKLVPP